MIDYIMKLQMEYCDPQCPKKVSTCPIVKRLEQHNRKNPEQLIYWCPKCDGKFYGWDTVEVGKQTVERAKYEGGLIIVGGKTHKTCKYDVARACDCACGKEAQKAGYRPHKFAGDEDKCYQQRIKDRFARIDHMQSRRERTQGQPQPSRKANGESSG
jgi:hypothetical protein